MSTSDTTTDGAEVAHRWAAGQRARIADVHPDARTWFVGNGRDYPEPVTLQPGDAITLVKRAAANEWYFRSPKFGALMLIDEPSMAYAGQGGDQ